MSALPSVVLVRHGQTEWSLAGRHTGFTDLPLTALGEANARGLNARLHGYAFEAVFSSPLQRAYRTCVLSGHAEGAIIDPDLREWNYGDYEGKRTAEIRQDHPQWQLFRDGCPGGESVLEMETRVDRVVTRLRAYLGTVLVFSSSHCLRVLAARWLRLEASGGALLQLDTTSISVLSYEHSLENPVIRSWNQVPAP